MAPLIAVYQFSFAQIPTPEEFHEVTVDTEAQQFYQEVWSPYCPGLSLHDCTSAQAAALRRDIALKFQSGKKKDEVLTELKTLYGDKVSMIPPKEGFSLSAYYLPFVALLVALLFFVRKIVFPKYRRRTPPGPLQQSLSDVEARKVDRWLKQ